MNGPVCVAVDVGNSSLKLATAATNHGDRLCVTRIPLSHTDWPQQVSDIAQSHRSDSSLLHWRIASVNSPASEHLVSGLNASNPGDRCDLIDYRHIDLDICVPAPRRVGIDRLLAAQGAFERSGKQAVMVIDAGTTITIDTVDRQGRFLGGGILPGIGLQFRCLHDATDKLPRMTAQDGFNSATYPGHDTRSAMNWGVFAGVVGSIKESYRQLAEVDEVFLTGGDAARISPCLSIKHQHIPELPLITLLSLDCDA